MKIYKEEWRSRLFNTETHLLKGFSYKLCSLFSSVLFVNRVGSIFITSYHYVASSVAGKTEPTHPTLDWTQDGDQTKILGV